MPKRVTDFYFQKHSCVWKTFIGFDVENTKICFYLEPFVMPSQSPLTLTVVHCYPPSPLTLTVVHCYPQSPLTLTVVHCYPVDISWSGTAKPRTSTWSWLCGLHDLLDEYRPPQVGVEVWIDTNDKQLTRVDQKRSRLICTSLPPSLSFLTRSSKVTA
jgi:hypothetical protein